MAHLGVCKQSGKAREQGKVPGPGHESFCYLKEPLDIEVWSPKEGLIIISELFQGNILNEMLALTHAFDYFHIGK